MMQSVQNTKGIAKCEEDVLSYALFPQVASKFFAQRDAVKEEPKAEAKADESAEVKTIYVEDLGL